MNQQAPLEAGEDGTFDVGDASPPPSPPKRVGIARSKQNETATAAVSTAAATDSDPCGSPPIKDDWEKVDLNGADEGLPPPIGNASQGGQAGAPPSPQEDFQDAVETQDESATQQTGTGATTTKDDSSCCVNDAPGQACGQAAPVESSAAPPPRSVVEQRPPGVGGRGNVIASGLANVRLPMGCSRQSRQDEEEDCLVDSDGEEQFHDAQDSGPGVVKDATKAREMKEAGNE